MTGRAITGKILLSGATLWLGIIYAGSPVARAEHETDHRFTIEGSVCAADGQPVSGVEVVAKDEKTSQIRTALTDDRGHYKVTLHLHNDNRGDTLAITALNKDKQIDREQKITAQFDPKDVHTERKTTVNFGVGCEALATGPPLWVYYGLGAAALAGGAWGGAKLLRARARAARGKKGGKR